MAISYVISYTFSPSTTISSSQVNTNFSDNANTWNGIEAETKTLAKLKMDADPTIALEVATKQYVDHYSTWRRPVLQYSSGTVVNMETGINGTSGQAQILFPDGNLRTDSTSGRINGNLAQVAALSGTAQSGLRTGTVVNNTWYACYAVKTSDNTSNFVMDMDTVFPTQANFATLNSNFGTNSWVYLGYIRYGDQKGTANAIVAFTMSGNKTTFRNILAGSAGNVMGISMADTASASSLSYTYATGSNGAVIPSTIVVGTWMASTSATAGLLATDQSGNRKLLNQGSPTGSPVFGYVPDIDLGLGIAQAASTGTPAMNMALFSYIDPVLGVGSNPIL